MASVETIPSACARSLLFIDFSLPPDKKGKKKKLNPNVCRVEFPPAEIDCTKFQKTNLKDLRTFGKSKEKNEENLEDAQKVWEGDLTQKH